GWQWWTGEQSVFLTQDSYVTGAAVLLGLNVMALTCHELGHALATKHSGRRVPVAGFLVYFGIPSVFVDTTDVWMAGRRARLLVTAAGPVTGLVLAGGCALVGLAVPEAAPWCFKLSFAWYVNALFNLNPFLALDGYYLVMDWLEVPNLRARGLSWVAARLRRRPPLWKTLDREGRLVALYGMLAVGWLLIAVNIGYRVYVDRVGGLVTGLWRSGWTARVLLFVVVAALMSPVVYIACGAAARRWRRLRQRMQQRRAGRDLPRRLDALRNSSLRELPGDVLTDLATKSRWVYPRTGEQVVFAGAAQADVFAVVDGALEGRAPGDPGGTVRERVGAGGVVGLGSAVSGSAASLSWYTAGTTLLAVPASAVAGVIGPLALGGTHTTAVEAETLLGESPAFAGLSYEDRLGLASVAVAVSVPPGTTITVTGPDEAIVVATGTITTPDGQEFGRGTLIGPAGESLAEPVALAVTRSPTRLFTLPTVSGLPLLLGTPVGVLTAESSGTAPGRPPVTGVHPIQAYAPLAVPPGPPPSDVDDSTDGRFEKRLRWLLILVLLLGLLFTGGNFLVSPLAFAEMPSDKAKVRVERGYSTVVVNGVSFDLDLGAEIYVGEADNVKVGTRSRASVTYRGGASSILCAGTDVTMGPLASTGTPVSPSAAVVLNTGLALMDTQSTSPAFTDLDSAVTLPDGVVTNDGPAWFAVAPWGIQVSQGKVSYHGSLVDADGKDIGCGDGTVVQRPSGDPTPTPSAGDTPSPTPSETPNPTATSNPTAPVGPANPRATTTTQKPIPGTTTTTPTITPSSPTTTTTPPVTSTPPATSSPSPPTNKAPVVTWAQTPPAGMDYQSYGSACNSGSGYTMVPALLVKVVDEDPSNLLTVLLGWSVKGPAITGDTIKM
ncbi:MAG: putative peptide zinc metalloprotease protein, partial [Micromonosporaceae bacterium]|nr:putative peptide zinc metalloprotease protein [Micromonosporaceae bacterium]